MPHLHTCALQSLHSVQESTGWWTNAEYLLPLKTKVFKTKVFIATSEICWLRVADVKGESAAT